MSRIPLLPCDNTPATDEQRAFDGRVVFASTCSLPDADLCTELELHHDENDKFEPWIKVEHFGATDLGNKDCGFLQLELVEAKLSDVFEALLVEGNDDSYDGGDTDFQLFAVWLQKYADKFAKLGKANAKNLKSNFKAQEKLYQSSLKEKV